MRLFVPDGSGDGEIQPPLNLTDIPIDDPFWEKRWAEESPYELCKALGEKLQRRLMWVPEQLKVRIVDVFRQCFEKSLPSESRRIIRDFVAFYPDLALRAPWLAELVRKCVEMSDGFGPQSTRNTIVRALADGFRKASDPVSQIRKSLEYSRLEAARYVSLEIRDELKAWGKLLDRSLASEEWLDEQASRKCVELVERYKIGKRQRRTLEQFLRQGNHYKASIVIAATVFRVRARNLEAKRV
jgi:hypothetical protein